MVNERPRRRLAAILAADMVGYSRLMEVDEDGIIARQKAHRQEMIDPATARHGGRIVKATGDGLLAEFPSAVDAVTCAMKIQAAMTEREATISEDRRIWYRIGINVGDIVIEDDDIFGTGVNLAARLEEIAEPGGICLSGAAYHQVHSAVPAEYEDIGAQTLKNISRPVQAYKIKLGSEATDRPVASEDLTEAQQEIRFCQAADGALIAYARVGHGPPMVRAPHWMNHLEHDWQAPVFRHLLRELAREHTLYRFDQRGNGLSDWDVEISFDAFVDDLETVVNAAGIDRFPLIGISQGCAVSIAYAVRHPERVTKLVLYGGYATGPLKSGSEEIRDRVLLEQEMILQGWGKGNPAFRQYFTTAFMPEATKEQMDWFNEIQRVSTSPENAAKIREALIQLDVSDLLAQIKIPTLVMHVRDDGVVPFEAGRRIAAGIPAARFVPLDGCNHLILETERAWLRFRHELREFLAEE